MEFRHTATKKPVMFVVAEKVDYLPNQIKISEWDDLPDVDYSMLGIPPEIHERQGRPGVKGWMGAFKNVSEFHLTFFASGFPDGKLPETVQAALALAKEGQS